MPPSRAPSPLPRIDSRADPDSVLHVYTPGRHSRHVRLHVNGAGVLDAVAKTEGDSARVVVAGRDTLKIVKITNRPPSPSPSTALTPPSPVPVQRSHSDRGTRRGRLAKAVGPGGTTAEETIDIWSGCKLGLSHASLDVAWGNGSYANKIVTACMNGHCVVWDINKSSNRVETLLNEHNRPTHRIVFHPEHSHYLLTGSSDNTARLWDIRSPFKSSSTLRHASAVHALCFEPSRGLLQCVTGLASGGITRWDLRQDSRPLDGIMGAHGGAVLDLKWRGRGMVEEWGTWLVSCGMDKAVKIWDLTPPTIPRSPKRVLRTSNFNRRVSWRPGYETELVVLPQPPPLARGGEEEAPKISIWDVRRGSLPKYVLEGGGAGAPTDMVWTGADFDSLLATYKDSDVVQHDLRAHTRPVMALPRAALAWDPSGSRLAFVADSYDAREVPFDEPPYDPQTHRRPYGTIAQSCRGPRYTPATSQVAGGVRVPHASDSQGFVTMARGYVLDKVDRAEACEINARVASEARHARAVQAWQLLHSILRPIPLPAPSPSPSPSIRPISTSAKSSKYSFSPLSVSSRRAASVGVRPRRRITSRPGSATAVPAAHVGEGALEDSDEESESEQEKQHSRNRSESSVLSSGVRSPLAQRPVMSIDHAALRRLSEADEEERVDADADVEKENKKEGPAHASPVLELQTDVEALASSSEGTESSAKRSERKTPRARRPRAQRYMSDAIGSTMASGSATLGELADKRRGSSASHSHSVGESQPDGAATSSSPGRGRGRTRRRKPRQEVLDAERRVRELGWAALRGAVDDFLADGDVQTCAALAIVAGEQLIADASRVVRVISSYLELLSRLQLHTCAAYVRKHSQHPEIRELASSSSTFATSCGRCNKAVRGSTHKTGEPLISGNFAFCSKCNRSVSRCSICHLPTKGLFFLCQTCGHGGHEDCYRRYYLSRPMVSIVTGQDHNSSNSSSTTHRSSGDPIENETRSGRPLITRRPESLLSTAPERRRDTGDDSEDEKLKERLSIRRAMAQERVLVGHPCVAGCGHTCWVANDRLLPSIIV